jgi:hypothetical protein
MAALGLELDTDRPKIAVDISQTPINPIPGESSGHVFVKEGPLTGVVRKPAGKALRGTLFFGEMRLGRDRDEEIIVIRYTQAQLPDGTKKPICSESSFAVGSRSPTGGYIIPAEVPIGVTGEWSEPWGRDL